MRKLHGFLLHKKHAVLKTACFFIIYVVAEVLDADSFCEEPADASVELCVLEEEVVVDPNQGNDAIGDMDIFHPKRQH